MTLADNFGLFDRSLDGIRKEARRATYPNSEAETKAVTALEQRIAAKVRDHESNLVAIADAVFSSGDRALAQADDLLTEMSDLGTDIERAGSRPSTALAARYESARKRMALRIAEPEKLERESEFHANQVSDPYGSLQNLRRKYPQVVMGRLI